MPVTIGSASRLSATLVAAGLPVVGVALDVNNVVLRIDTVNDIPFTAQQQTQANSIIAAFDFSDAANAAFIQGLEPDLQTLRQQAVQAVADINTFLAIASPTNAQVVAEVRAIDQRLRAIIKAVARIAAIVQGA